MNSAFYILVMCLTICHETTIALSNNNKVHIGKELNSKADGALPILHLIFDVASGANAQSISGATRRLLNALLPQNVAEQFEGETMMSISTFSGVDLEDGNYLMVLSPPVNVIQNSEALRDIIQFEVSDSMTNAITRDPGAAIRDAVSFSSQFNSGAGDILYLVSRRYVDAGSTVKELDMIDTLWLSSVTLICVEGGDISDPNRLFNLKRVTELTEGYYFTNTGTQTNNWPSMNDAAVNQMLSLARSPIDLVGRKVDRAEYFGVSNVVQIGSLFFNPEFGTNSVIAVQSSQKGTVTMDLTNVQTGVTATLTTMGGTNWNMINSNLYLDALDLPPGESRGTWVYALTFEPDTDALDSKSDVVILGLSTKNENPLENLLGVWTSDCSLDFPDQQNTIIYAQVIGSVGVLTGLYVTVSLKNVEDTSSQDVLSIILIEEVQGMGLYSGIFNPPSNGLYDFSAEFTADTDSECIGDVCAPSDFSASAQGRCRIQVQGKDSDTTTTNEPTSTTDATTNEPSTSTPDPTTSASVKLGRIHFYPRFEKVK